MWRELTDEYLHQPRNFLRVLSRLQLQSSQTETLVLESTVFILKGQAIVGYGDKKGIEVRDSCRSAAVEHNNGWWPGGGSDGFWYRVTLDALFAGGCGFKGLWEQS